MLGVTQYGLAKPTVEGINKDCMSSSDTAGQSCIVAGTYYENGMENGEIDHKKAFTFYERGCEIGNAEACKNVGFYYSEGWGVKADKKKALPFFEQACDGDDFDGCYNLGIAYNEGEVIKKDLTVAQKLFEKSCSKGNHPGGCYNMGYAYMVGKGIKKNSHKANSYFDKSCESNMGMACFNIGVGYFKGDTRVKSTKFAIDFFKKSCALGVSKGCEVASDLDPSFIVSNTFNLYTALNKAFTAKTSCTVSTEMKGLNIMITTLGERIKDKKGEDFTQNKQIVVKNSKKEILVDISYEIFTNKENHVLGMLRKNNLLKSSRSYYRGKKNKDKESMVNKVKMNGFNSPTTYFISKDDMVLSRQTRTMGDSDSSGFLVFAENIFKKDTPSKNIFTMVELVEFDGMKQNLTGMNVELYDFRKKEVKYSNLK